MSIASTAAARDKPDKPYEVRADRPMGLLLRVQPSGARTYYVQLGRGRRIRLGRGDVMTLKQAEEAAKRALLNPAATSKPADTLRDWIDHHYEPHALARLKRGDRSVARVRNIWKSLLSRRVADLSPALVDRLRDRRILDGASPATVNRDVSALRGVLSHWAKATGHEHPLRGLDVLEVADDEQIRYLDNDELDRLQRALVDRDARLAQARQSANEWRGARDYELLPSISGDHLSPMVGIALFTGVRRGELFGLEWRDVDLARKTILVRASNAKGSTTRVVPLNRRALEVFQSLHSPGCKGLVFPSPVSGKRFDNIRKSWAEVTRAAGIECRWHDLRHTFASRLVMAGIPLYTVQVLLGHSTPRMTQRYARLAPVALAEAVEVLA